MDKPLGGNRIMNKEEYMTYYLAFRLERNIDR